jgi:hypothetical protein
MDLTVLGAFLSGAGAVLSAIVSLRSVRKRAEAECEKRLEALREGFRMRGE